MSTKKAKDRLRWYLQNEDADCPTYEDMKEIYDELLESEPKPTEFWVDGNEPKEANWYLIECLSCDRPPVKFYEKAWYNPDSIEKWWLGAPGNIVPFHINWRTQIIRYVLFRKTQDIIDRLTAENKELKEKYETYTKGHAKYYHDIWCNANRNDPVGKGICSCTIGKKIEQLQAELKVKDEEMARFRRALKREGYDTNPMQSGPDIRD